MFENREGGVKYLFPCSHTNAGSWIQLSMASGYIISFHGFCERMKYYTQLSFWRMLENYIFSTFPSLHAFEDVMDSVIRNSYQKAKFPLLKPPFLKRHTHVSTDKGHWGTKHLFLLSGFKVLCGLSPFLSTFIVILSTRLFPRVKCPSSHTTFSLDYRCEWMWNSRNLWSRDMLQHRWQLHLHLPSRLHASEWGE